MNDARPYMNRELRIEDDARQTIRGQIDPLIRAVMLSRGYVEDRTSSDVISLDSSTVIPSKAYMDTIAEAYNGLMVRTRYDVSDGERTLIGGRVTLRKIGGFATAHLVMSGSRFTYSIVPQSLDPHKVAPTEISEHDFGDILEDVRAQTVLGGSTTDTVPPVADLFDDIDHLTNNREVERRSLFELLTDDAHGDVTASVGETYEERDIVVKGRLQHRARSRGKMFEFISKQPLDTGTVSMGLYYHSETRGTEMKISTVLEGTRYDEVEQEAMYQEAIRSFQDPRYTRFGDAAIKNLKLITDPNSAIIRVG